MSNNTFDRVVLNNREKPLSDDNNREWSQEDRTIRDVLRAMSLIHPSGPGVASNGQTPMSPAFMGDAFFAEPNGGMVLKLRAGVGFIYSAADVPTNIDAVVGLDDRSPFKPVVLMADQTLNIDAGVPAGQERIDIIEIKPYRRRTDANTRSVFDVGSGTGIPQSVLKNLAWTLDGEVGQVISPASSTAGISVKKGTLQAVGTYAATTYDQGVPAVTAGYTKIGQIYCGPSVAALAAGDLVDSRKLWAPYGQMTLSFRVTQTDGVPDVILVHSNPLIPPGTRVAVRSTGNNGASLEVFLFVGDMGLAIPVPGNSTPIIGHVTLAASATAYMPGPALGTPTYDFLDSTDKTNIAAQVAVGLGQKRVKWILPYSTVVGGPNVVRTWNFTMHLRMV